eukprot:46722_1
MQSKYITFYEMVMYKKANLWSKSIRIPKSSIIYDVINNECWERWQNIRNKDKNIDKYKNKKIDLYVEGIKPRDIQIMNELNKNDIDTKEEWDYKDVNDEEDETFILNKKKNKNNKKRKK